MNSILDLSIAVITYNEEEKLPKTLESIKDIAGEIVVIDSHSTDNTVSIAESYGAKVYIEDWKGFAMQKNSLLEKCTKNWILFLDADEEVGEELKKDIINTINNPTHSGYYIRRKTHYIGKLLKYSWQPDTRLRLVKKESSPLWIGEIVHEELQIKGSVGQLKGYIIHYSYKDMKDHFIKTVNYAKLSAESYIKKGKKPSLTKLLFTPPFSFFKFYILKGGFLDGTRGFIASMSAYIYAFLKYAFLWEYYNKGKK